MDEALKTLYKTEGVKKCYIIYFPSLGLNINTEGTNDHMLSGSFSLHERLFEGDNIDFGSCIAAEVKFTVFDIEQNLTDLEFELSQVLDGYETPIKLGTFRVRSCKRQSNKRFKDIVAYDSMTKLDTDVAGWYNSLDFTDLTLRTFRASFLTYLGIAEDIPTAPLPNDSMVVLKTIEPTQLSGSEVAKRIEELNGCFGHISPQGKFKHIVLKPSYGLYPANNVFPSPVLLPSEQDNQEYRAVPDEVITKGMMSQPLQVEDYDSKALDKLIIRQEEDDIGAIVGEGTNAYIIEGNFLVFGKSAEELQTIANNAFKNIYRRYYQPYEANLIGLPYLELGSFVKCDSSDIAVYSYLFNRTLTGIQALRDKFVAEGSEVYSTSFDSNKEIIQLKSKALLLQRNVDGIKAEVSDLDKSTQAGFNLTAESILAEVKRATEQEEFISGQIDILAGQVVLKVGANGNVGYIALDGNPDTDLTSIVLKANNLSLNGYVGINGSIVVTEDGKLHAVDGEFSGSIAASEFIGGVARSSNYYSGVSGMMIDFNNSTIDMINLYVDPTGRIKSTNGEIITNGVNGSVTIKDGKITLRNSLLQATAEFDGSDMWIDYIVIRETANFIKNVNFQLNSAPMLSIGGVPQSFITSVNIHSYLGDFVTSTELSNAMGVLDKAIRTWATSTFAPKA